jgi:ribosomal-protein-alanine N-acetyltransferase
MVHLYPVPGSNEVRVEEVTLREYRTADLQSIYALDVVCFAPPFRFSRGAMRSFAEAAGAMTVLAEARDELAGFCIVQLEKQTAYVVTLDVAPAWRRRGLARRLMAELESKARAAGATGMALHVFTGNTGAIQFYESVDYNRAGRAEDFYGRGLDALVYRKKVEG